MASLNDIPIQAADHAGMNALQNTTQPERANDIKSAWAATVKEIGQPDFDARGPTRTETEPAEEAETDQKAEATEKKTEPAAKAKEKSETEEERGARKLKELDKEANAEEEPDEERNPTVRGLIKERVRLREKDERREASFQERSNQLETHWKGEYQKLNEQARRLLPLHKAAEALEHGDPDDFAKYVGEYRGLTEIQKWNDVSDEFLKATNNPAHRENRAIRKKLADIEARDAEGRKTQETQRQQREREQAEYQFRSRLTSALDDDEDPAIAELTSFRPYTADHTLRNIRDHYHASGGEELAPRAAAEKALEAIVKDLSEWRGFLEKHADSPIVQKLMGNRTAPKSAATNNGNRKAATSERRGGQPPKNVSHTQGASASQSAPMSDRDLIKHYAAKMESEGFAQEQR